MHGDYLSVEPQQAVLLRRVGGRKGIDCAGRQRPSHLLGAVSRGGIEAINLLPEDYARIVSRHRILNQRNADLPGDFADITLKTLSERLDVAEILSLDSDFDIYRRFRRQPFRRVSL